MDARSAILPDAVAIRALIDAHTSDGTLLPRSLPELYENIRDFVVVEDDGVVVGCGALHLYGEHLAEIRSIAVMPEARGWGAGRLLVRALLRESLRQQVSCVCVFTRIPGFFAPFGFVVTHETLPDKLYKDCRRCARRHACDEIAMIRGPLPETEVAPRLAGIRRPIVAAGGGL
ncbi:MAG: GNAT family N-acetyltransferase [Candidatus Latescibacteria bacterium]|nr:GNAT family N-acetyltransferase [Candidatus Latescibacterota bacterium]